jgi:predicted DNA-binding transcriptional regulator AlpA
VDSSNERPARKAALSSALISERLHAAHAPPTLRLLNRHEVCAITGMSYPTLWAWMRSGRFPRSRTTGGKGKVMWLSTEVEAWVNALPKSVLKGDLET